MPMWSEKYRPNDGLAALTRPPCRRSISRASRVVSIAPAAIKSRAADTSSRLPAGDRATTCTPPDAVGTSISVTVAFTQTERLGAFRASSPISDTTLRFLNTGHFASRLTCVRPSGNGNRSSV